ncbi:DNA cytosine methyltransferase [Cyanobium sp. A2C-AMD]|uniref:DNA cytosine methyltransferase n=1 Tax=Cyanobium sp. A2C-AMD TaxID=2823695 RepID=UPI0020CF41B7|nr:DNA (cytosine-5-)-methyltransferase [Cyanobium sp. A2C-AMD]
MASIGSTVGLFAGIGGFELGLEEVGFSTELLCEIEPGARAVLAAHFADTSLHDDVSTLGTLPAGCTVLAAGFPCQDLSQAGRGAGITGGRSGLVVQVFRLLDGPESTLPTWVLLENVPFMLQLDQGRAMHLLTTELSSRGYRWAYRIVDARAFGLPQRRRRVLLLASRTEDPRPPLFGQDEQVPRDADSDGRACGFYWTEGNTGLGWVVDGVPTIKGGSGLGIPSPPALWMPDGSIVTPDIRDAERLQGFKADWSRPAEVVLGLKRGVRWKLVGNAVCVPMASWIAKRLAAGVGDYLGEDSRFPDHFRWPNAAWGDKSGVRKASVGEFPVKVAQQRLHEFLEFQTHPLSERAVRGFRNRLAASRLRYPRAFLQDLDRSVEQKSLKNDFLQVA